MGSDNYIEVDNTLSSLLRKSGFTCHVGMAGHWQENEPCEPVLITSIHSGLWTLMSNSLTFFERLLPNLDECSPMSHTWIFIVNSGNICVANIRMQCMVTLTSTPAHLPVTLGSQPVRKEYELGPKRKVLPFQILKRVGVPDTSPVLGNHFHCCIARHWKDTPIAYMLIRMLQTLL